MIFAICEALDLQLSDRNELLLAAGYAPGYRRTALQAPEMESIRSSIDRLLERSEPYPAIVYDTAYNVQKMNNSALNAFCYLLDIKSPEQLPDYARNVLRLILHPAGIRRFVLNWSEVAVVLLRRMRAETLSSHCTEKVRRLYEEVCAYPGIPSHLKSDTHTSWQTPVLSVDIEKDGRRLSLFSMLTTLGAPYDLTLQELRIESFFPNNAESVEFFTQWNMARSAP